MYNNIYIVWYKLNGSYGLPILYHYFLKGCQGLLAYGFILTVSGLLHQHVFDTQSLKNTVYGYAYFLPLG